jgi:hypothetical protein
MRTPDAVRQGSMRRRPKLGLRMVQVEISEEAAEADERPVSRVRRTARASRRGCLVPIPSVPGRRASGGAPAG